MNIKIQFYNQKKFPRLYQIKNNLHSYLTDAAKGNRYFNKVDVQVPAMGPDGQPKLDEEGNPVMINRKMTFEDQMALFRAGKIKKVNYNGSENKVKMNPFAFLQRPKDPSKPFDDDNVVTASNVKFQAMEMGASEGYATELARSYVDMVNNGGDTWKWGNKSKEEQALINAPNNES